MKKIKFYKYHGLGNDFLIIDLINKRSTRFDFNDLALKICNRHFGVGADGIMVLTSSKVAMCCIDLFNSDGSWAEKSGNGLRCVAAYYYSHYSRRKKMMFEINNEVSNVIMMRSGKGEYQNQVSLGVPEFETKKIPMRSKGKYHINSPIDIEGTKFPVTALSVGNPHAVMFVDKFDFDWRELGRIIEHSKYFPHRTNVEFAKIVNRKRVILNDWERGAGDTGSSGTGASATVVAGVVNGFLERNTEVVFPAGSLFIDWSTEDDNILLTGPVNFVCEGEYQYDEK